MIRTRVGYVGGTTKNPTYQKIGDYTEGLQIDFDPAVISYQKLLDTFWTDHFHCRRAFSKQYMKAVFYHDNTQKKLAENGLKQTQKRQGKKVTSQVLPVTDFYRAEDYHQKYMLRMDDKLMKLMGDQNITPEQFTDSTLAARLNGYAGGHGNKTTLKKQLEPLNLEPAFLEELWQSVEE